MIDYNVDPNNPNPEDLLEAMADLFKDVYKCNDIEFTVLAEKHLMKLKDQFDSNIEEIATVLAEKTAPSLIKELPKAMLHVMFRVADEDESEITIMITNLVKMGIVQDSNLREQMLKRAQCTCIQATGLFILKKYNKLLELAMASTLCGIDPMLVTEEMCANPITLLGATKEQDGFQSLNILGLN